MGILRRDDEIFILKSDGMKVAKELQSQITEIGIAFAKLDSAIATSLNEVVAPILRRINERNKLVDDDMIGEEEEKAEQEEEEQILLPHLEKHFPFITAANSEKKIHYVVAFLEYCAQRKRIQ